MDAPQSGANSATAAQRQTERIRYSYRLRIFANDSSGYRVEDDARTEVITRDGGLIVTPLSLSIGAVVAMRRGNRETPARIVAQVGIRDENYMYGVQFTELLTEPFWDVNFPPYNGESSAGRVVLQCSPCSRQELLRLSEIEMLVFENMKVIPRVCENCKRETLWIEPALLGDFGLVSGSAAYNGPNQNPSKKRDRNVNDRRHARVGMRNIRACLQRRGFSDDVVNVLDLSRGGIRFISLVDYVPGTKIEVAVPYTEGGANVFTPARVARVRCRPTVDLPGEFGLEYIKN
jgi:hypothetical protein